MAMDTANCISLTLWMDPSAWLVLEQVFICKEEAGRSSLYNVLFGALERELRRLGPKILSSDRALPCQT